jgi:hypothetical protein
MKEKLYEKSSAYNYGVGGCLNESVDGEYAENKSCYACQHLGTTGGMFGEMYKCMKGAGDIIPEEENCVEFILTTHYDLSEKGWADLMRDQEPQICFDCQEPNEETELCPDGNRRCIMCINGVMPFIYEGDE